MSPAHSYAEVLVSCGEDIVKVNKNMIYIYIGKEWAG